MLAFLSENWDKVSIAVFTGLLVLFTYCLWRSTEKLWLATKASVDAASESAQAAKAAAAIAHQEFISSHRPSLVVRRAVLKIVRGRGLQDCPAIEYEVANVGGTAATLVEVNARVWLRDTFPLRPEYAGEPEAGAGTLIHAGSYWPLSHYVNYGDEAQKLMFMLGFTKTRVEAGHKPEELHIYFVGYVLYKDALGVARRTAFFRTFDELSQRFVVRQRDPDYEHAD